MEQTFKHNEKHFASYIGIEITRYSPDLVEAKLVTREELSWRTHLGPFGAWQLEHFGSPANSPFIGGPGADPDGDQRANLLEYVTGTDPGVGEEGALRPQVGGIAFARNVAATDVVLSVEWTPRPDTVAWQPLATKMYAAGWTTNPAVSVSDAGDGSVLLIHTTPADAACYRLRVGWP